MDHLGHYSPILYEHEGMAHERLCVGVVLLTQDGGALVLVDSVAERVETLCGAETAEWAVVEAKAIADRILNSHRCLELYRQLAASNHTHIRLAEPRDIRIESGAFETIDQLADLCLPGHRERGAVLRTAGLVHAEEDA